MNRRQWCSAAVCLLLLAGVVSAEPVTRYVPDDYAGIQQAIMDCNDGDTVVVREGLYFEWINFSGKNITLTSEDPNDPAVVANTILNGDADGTVVTFENGESRSAVLQGFTINSGYGTYDDRFGEQELIWGAGIYVADASPTIRNNVIAENHGPIRTEDPMVMCYGGGLACINSAALVVNNTFHHNSAAAGGAIIVWYGPTEVRSNLIYRNSAAIGGGVILLGGRLINSTVVNNDVDLTGPFGDDKMAGNVYAAAQDDSEQGRCLVLNNIIANAKSGYGLFLIDDDRGLVDVAYNDIWGNLPGDVFGLDPSGEMPADDVVDLSGWNGNISADPFFTDPGDDEYHLLLESPCINAGDPDYVPAPGERDIDGQARTYAVVIDMGADEYVGYIKPVADAGRDIHVAGPELVMLDGTDSFFYDPCGIEIYNWTQIDGPPLDPNDPNNTEFYHVELSDPLSPQPTFTPGPLGHYRFELLVSDDEYVGRPDQVLVIVGNERPVARAGMDRVVRVPADVTLDGTESYDPDPTDELTFAWTQVEGPPVELIDPNSANPHFDCNETGAYAFELIVNDGFEDSLPATVRVTTVAVTLNQQSLSIAAESDEPGFYPAVSGSRVAYSSGPSWHYSWDIKVEDLNTQQTTTLTGGGIDTQPDIDGDLVVWSGGPTMFEQYNYTSIFAADLANNRKVTLRSHAAGKSYSHPAISGRKVVWLQHLNASEFDWEDSRYDIVGADVADLDNPMYFTIAEDVGARQPYPRDTHDYDYDDVIDISGNIVVWEAEGDIYGADISDIDNIALFTICDHPARQYDPAVSGGIVVWTDERNDGGDIYGARIADLQSISEMQIAKAAGSQLQPAIDGCLIAYIEGSAYGGTLRACAVTKESGILNVQLDGFPYAIGPAVEGDVIIYQQGTYGRLAGMSLEFGYSAQDGPIQNVSTGNTYDYIQHAIYAAQDGETVVVPPGTYRESLRFANRNITVRSQDPEDSDVVASTVLTGAGSIVNFAGGQDPNCLLAGFTIAGGSVGIYCFDARPTIENCAVVDNSSHGIELRKESDAHIRRSRIADNGGSGIETVVVMQGRNIWHSRPTVMDSIIASNAKDGVSGGGPTLVNCTVVQNSLRGIYSKDRVDSQIVNSIVYHNGAGPDVVQIQNPRATVSYSAVQGGFPGPGNTDRDPMFESLGHWSEQQDPCDPPVWIPGDYHLPPGSPCVDAGDPNAVITPNRKDLEGHDRVVGDAVDMGALEVQPERPVIGLSQPEFVFEASAGAEKTEDQLLLITNAGSGTLNWQIAYDSNWLEVEPQTGTVSDRSSNVWLKVKPGGLPAGEHICDIAIADPASANGPVTLRIRLTVEASCFPDTPQYALQYADYLRYVAHGADPSCWCAAPHGSGYQCDGDADGRANAFVSHRIYTNDLALLIKNWKRKIDTADPCADFDHKADLVSGYRVSVGDLNVLIANWKKTDEQLPGDCPRADSP